jgi:hypothetical protein
MTLSTACPKPAKRERRPRKPIVRTAMKKQRAPVKARNVKRHAAELLRTYGPPERREWVKAQPCIVSGYTPCDNAHIEGDGAGRKAGFDKIVPLTRKHHRELHKGRAAFEKKYDLDLDALAALTELAWRAATEREPSNG